MKEIASILLLPLVAGIILFIIPDKFRTFKAFFSLLITSGTIYLAISIYAADNQFITLNDFTGAFRKMDIHDDIWDRYIIFHIDNLSRLIVLFTSILSFLILLYSVKDLKTRGISNYFSYFLLTTGCSFGAVLSDNLLLFLLFWGVLGLTLYKLIGGSDEESSAAAKKTLILIGASDSIMILGIAIIWKVSGSLNIDEISIPTTNTLSVLACLALLCGSFTKAGAFPFHTWVPDYTKNAPAASSALLPATLDKMLGIYFLARITGNLFILNDLMKFLLLLTGSITIIVAVMMALIQHNYKRLLGFHAVSQVGYMILGFGLGSATGIAAGLFHMLNNAFYKGGLFLTAGNIEQRTGLDNIDDLGGLAKAMPVTFFSSLLFALSISGVPPFNGFASKWMIYQGIIDFGGGTGMANRLWVLWLGLAVLGSALTLASFIKLTGGIFLGRHKPELSGIREVPFMMWLPVIVLALTCLLFGVFATGSIVPALFMPVTGQFSFTGIWDSSLASLLILISIALGIILYVIAGLKRFRTEDSFIGGEKIQDETGFSTTEFYKTITEFRTLSWIYRKAEERWFDIYDLSKRLILSLNHELSRLHDGVLAGYIIWVVAGLVIMFLILI